MSVFMGKFSDGKTVLSLRNRGGTAWGEDAWEHHDPQLDSIFHSDMPHMFIEEYYAANTWHAGDGYFITPMPSRVVETLANAADRVVITSVTFRSNEGDEYKSAISGNSINFGTALQGRASQVGSWQNGYNTVSSGIWFSSFNQSADVTLDVGYFWYDTNNSFKTMLSHGSSRRIFWHAETVHNSNTNGGGRPPNPFAVDYWYMAGFMFFDSDGSGVPGYNGPANNNTSWYATKPNVIRNFHVDWWRPPTSRGTGYSAIYIRMGMPRLLVGSFQRGGWVPEGGEWLVNESANNSAGPQGGSWICRSWTGNPIDAAWDNVGAKEIKDQIQWGWTPVQVEWYFTNFWFNGSDGYNVSNIFTGNDILFSRDNFTVKGQNLMNVGRKMVMAVDAGESARNWRDVHIGSNVYKWDLNSNPINFLGGIPKSFAKKGWCGMAAVDGGTFSNFGPASIAIHEFVPGKQWYLDGTVPSIGNQDGDIWSPSSVPLKNFEWNKSAFWLGGQSVWSDQNNMTWLAEADIGFASSRAGTGLIMVQFHDLPSYMSCGGFGSFMPLRALGPNVPMDNTWMNVVGNMDARPQRFFNISVIPPNCHVPVFTVRNGITNDNISDPFIYIRDGANNHMLNEVLYYSMTLWIHNNADGKVSLWVSVSRNDPANRAPRVKFRIPGMYVHVQKLT
ncbi:receptor-binding protein [Serratia phage vB_SmaM-Kamaji]|nr:receptor-binding protein [Serratia phage vB_SmaM-Kamaji]